MAAPISHKVLPTTIVGSLPQPDWLIDRAGLAALTPPRIRARELWRIPEPLLEAAQDDATLLAIRAQERAGIDLVGDGEMRRESYSNRFATALDGVDIDKPGMAPARTPGKFQPVPRIVGPIRRRHPVELRDLAFLKANTDRPVKMTVPGPFTMAQQAVDEHYKDEEALAMAYAAAVNEEVRDLFAAGADVVQIDEPYLQSRPDKAARFGVAALDRALEGIDGTTAVHLCFGYAAFVKARPSGYSFLAKLERSRAQQVSIETAQSNLDCAVLRDLPSKTIILGVIDLGTEAVETPDAVAARIRRALAYVAPERLVVAPDCGMKYLPRDVAFAKLKAMAAGAAIVRRDLGAD